MSGGSTRSISQGAAQTADRAAAANGLPHRLLDFCELQDCLASSATGHLMRRWCVDAPILAKHETCLEALRARVGFQGGQLHSQPAVRAAVNPPPG